MMGVLETLAGLIAKWASSRAVYAWAFRVYLTSVPFLPYVPFKYLNNYDRSYFPHISRGISSNFRRCPDPGQLS